MQMQKVIYDIENVFIFLGDLWGQVRRGPMRKLLMTKYTSSQNFP